MPDEKYTMEQARERYGVRDRSRSVVRRLWTVTWILFVVVATVIAAALLMRKDVLHDVLQDRLSAMGIADASFTVARVSDDEIRIVDFRADDTLRFDRLTLRFDPGELLDGRVRGVELIGLRADLTRPDEGAVGALLGGRGEGDGAAPDPPPIPAITLKDARITAALAGRTIPLAIDGTVGPLRKRSLPMRLDLGLETPSGRATGKLAARVILGFAAAPDTQISGRLSLKADKWDIAGLGVRSATASIPLALRISDAEITGRLGSGIFLTAERLRDADDNRLESATILATGTFAVPLSGESDTMFDGRLRLRATTAVGAGMALDNVRAVVPLEIRADANGARLRLPKAASVTVRAVRRGDGLELRKVAAKVLASLDMSSEGERPLTGSAELTSSIDTLSLGETRLSRLTMALPVTIEAAGGTATLALAKPGRITVQKATIGAELRLDRAVSLTLNSGKSPLLRSRPTEEGNRRLEFDVALNPSRLVLREGRGRGPAGKITADLDPLVVTGSLDPKAGFTGRVGLGGARLAARGRRLAMGDTRLDLSAGPKTELLVAKLQIDALRQLEPASPVSPLSLAATLRPSGHEIGFAVTLSHPATGARAVIDGKHDGWRRAGRADMSTRGLDFIPGGAQPGQIVPALATFKDVGGSIEASARLRWRDTAVDGTARVKLTDIGATTEDGSIEGITGEITLDRLFPPTTPAGQKVTIRTIDVGPKLGDSVIGFALLKSGKLHIERAQSTLAGGRLRLVDTTFDPAARTNAATIRVDDVELAELLGLFDLGDVHATGRLTGAIPVQLSNNAIVVRDGKLAATGGGTLRVQSEKASQVLSAGGQQVQLLLRALEDFHYQELSVGVEKSAGGDMIVSLSTLGNNPKVLDGHPFRINVNLDTNLDRVLGAVSQWYRLSGRALRDIVGGTGGRMK